MSRSIVRVALACVMIWVTGALGSAQQQTTTTTETKTFEVIAVTGNDLVVKLPEGTKELTVPEDFRFTVDGRQLSVHELKPGMKGTATITTKTTSHPVTVTEVKNGTVRQVTGSTMIVQTDQGFKSFTQSDVDKRGVRIMRNGEPAQLSDFHAGDTLSATIITTRPARVMTEKQVQATLARTAAATAGAPSAEAAASPAAARSAASATGGASTSSRAAGTSGGGASAGRKLPKTASPVPLIGLIGVVSLVLALALATRRRMLMR